MINNLPRLTLRTPTLRRLNISHATSIMGGGIYLNQGGQLHILDSVFSDLVATQHGGAIATDVKANVAVKRCTFERNQAGGMGGAIYFPVLYPTNVAFEDNKFISNSATLGGAVKVQSYETGSKGFVFLGCQFESNKASDDGGDIYCDRCQISSCSFHSSSATEGGSIFINSLLSVHGSSFYNVSGNSGGVLKGLKSTTVSIHSSIFHRNRVTFDGLFLLQTGSTLSVINSTFNATSIGSSGLFYMYPSTRTYIDNCSIENIAADSSSGLAYISHEATMDINNSTITAVHVSGRAAVELFGDNSFLTIRDSTLSYITSSTAGLVWMWRRSRLKMVGCTLESINSLSDAGVVHALGDSKAEIVNTTISGLVIDSNGGVAFVEDSATVNITGSFIASVSAETTGAVGYVSGSGTLRITDTRINHVSSANVAGVYLTDNSFCELTRVRLQNATGGTIAGFALYGESHLLARDSSFSHSKISGEFSDAKAFVSLYEGAVAEIRNVHFEHIRGGSFGAAVYTATTTAEGFLDISNSHFISNVAIEGAGVYADVEPQDSPSSLSKNVKITNCIFQDNRAFDRGAAVSINNLGNLELSSSIFRRNFAIYGGAISVSGSCRQRPSTRFENCTFEHNYGTLSGGAVFSYLGTMDLHRCRFENNSILDIWSPLSSVSSSAEALSSSSSSFSSSPSIITQTQARSHINYGGGGVTLVENGLVTIRNSTFYANRAGPLRGGGILCVNSTKKTTTNRGEGTSGSTTATNTTGSSSTITISTTIFRNNTANGGSGGAIFWDTLQSKPSLTENVEFIQNSAQEGSDIASGPFSIRWSGFDPTAGVKQVPGEYLKGPLRLEIFDYYGNLKCLDSSFQVTAELTMLNSSAYFMYGGVRDQRVSQVFDGGHACFGEDCTIGNLFNVFGPINSKLLVKTTSAITWTTIVRTASATPSSLPSTERSAKYTYYLETAPTHISTTPCKGQEVFIEDHCQKCGKLQVPNHNQTSCYFCPMNSILVNGTKCICTKDFFSYSEEEKGGYNEYGELVACTACPSGGDCDQEGLLDYQVQPLKGYWLDKWSSSELRFDRCRNNACIGSRDECAAGYSGVLCTECSTGNGRFGTYGCEKCGANSIIIVQLIAAWIGIFLAISFLAHVNIKDSEEAIAEAAATTGEQQREHQIIDDNHDDDAKGEGNDDDKKYAAAEVNLGVSSPLKMGKQRQRKNRNSGRPSKLVKIGFNALQFNSIIGGFQVIVESSSSLRTFMSGQSVVGVPLSIPNFDCALQSANISIRPIYCMSFVLACVPFFVPFFASLLATILQFRDSSNKSKNCRFTTFSQFCSWVKRMVSKCCGLCQNDEYEDGIESYYNYDNEEVVRNGDGESNQDIHSSKVRYSRALELPSSSSSKSINHHPKQQQQHSDSKHHLVFNDDGSTADTTSSLSSSSSLPPHVLWRSRFFTIALTCMFAVYPALVIRSFELFNCEQISSSDESSVVLVSDMSQRCYEGTQLSYMMVLGIPMLIVYVLGFPIFCLTMLLKHKMNLPVFMRHRLDLTQKEKFQRQRRAMPLYLLYNGYKPEFYYFEIIVFARKIAVVVISVFVDQKFKFLLSVLLITVCMMLQLRCNPFQDFVANSAEFTSLLISFSIVVAGLFLEQVSSSSVSNSIANFIIIITAMFYGVLSIAILLSLIDNHKNSPILQAVRRKLSRFLGPNPHSSSRKEIRMLRRVSHIDNDNDDYDDVVVGDTRSDIM